MKDFAVPCIFMWHAHDQKLFCISIASAIHVLLTIVVCLQASVVSKTTANSISELQNEFEDSESSKEDLPEASDKDQESGDEDDKKRKAALERLEKASEDTFLGQASSK
ncbi:hypothetical protein R6Q57_019294 [Mikania cordata]